MNDLFTWEIVQSARSGVDVIVMVMEWRTGYYQLVYLHPHRLPVLQLSLLACASKLSLTFRHACWSSL
jgi:hypothetical protein